MYQRFRQITRVTLFVSWLGVLSGCARVPMRNAPAATVAPEYVFALSALTRPPRLLNGDQIDCLVDSHYPNALRLYGITGTTTLLLTVDPEGRVFEAKVQTSSGTPSIDQVATQVARSLRFVPGRFGRRAVWSQFPAALPIGPGARRPDSSVSPGIGRCP